MLSVMLLMTAADIEVSQGSSMYFQRAHDNARFAMLWGLHSLMRAIAAEDIAAISVALKTVKFE